MAMSPKLLRPRQTGFSPSSLTGLYAWWDFADAGTVTLNGGNVSQIADKSGNGRALSQATAANQPAYTSAGQNGKSVATFDGTRFLQNATGSNWTFLHNGSNSYALFVAIKPNMANGEASQLLTTGQAASQGCISLDISRDDGVDVSLAAVMYDADGVVVASNALTLPNNDSGAAINSARGIAVLGAPAVPSMSIYDTSATVADPPFSSGSASGAATEFGLVVGGFVGVDPAEPAGSYGGWIAEMLIYRRAAQLSAAQRNQVLNYLKSKWALP